MSPLVVFWYIALAVLWTGVIVLEGYDFGVGMLHSVVGRDERGRGTAMATIGPLWDGNEVWLVVAAAGTFAAFPVWYATMFSAFYPLVVLLLVGLIVRGVSFEFRSRQDSARVRMLFDWLLVAGSLLTPFLVGMMLGDLLHGVPINSGQEFVGGFGDLVNGYALFTGATFVVLSLLHGASFLALRTTGDLRDRSTRIARVISPAAIAVVFSYVIWTHVTAGRGYLPSVLEIAAMLAVIGAAWLVAEGRDGPAFMATGFTMAAVVGSLFVDLYPRVMVSTLSGAPDLTVRTTSSATYSLTVMTVIALVLLPMVIAYQAWSFHVFRRRLGRAGAGARAASGDGRGDGALPARGPVPAAGRSDNRKETR
jgi:cytochrome bd ubiquinol oxidase subunit II